LQVFKEEIKRLIAEEIVSRYFYQKGRMEVILRDDPAIKSVFELIDNPQEYKRILTSGSPGK
jgi:carboxyl-terminal processing protease